MLMVPCTLEGAAKSNSPPCPRKERRDKDEAAAGFEILFRKDGPAPTLHDNETKQVEFVRATGIQSQRLYIYDGAQIEQYGYYSPDQVRNDPGYGTASNPQASGMQGVRNAGTNTAATRT